MIVLIAALILDMFLGDPRSWPHPVKWIGTLAGNVESVCRKRFSSERFGGIIATVILVGGTAVSASILLAIAAPIDFVHTALSVLILYWSIAPKDLVDHSVTVYKAMKSGDLIEARRAVSMIVGRDTANLSESQIVRATVETVAESSVDGVMAPLFWFFLLGPVGAITYRAINTLDSIYGHKNERYIRFGTAAAKLDDIATYIPARLSILSIAVAAFFLNLRGKSVIPTALKYAHRHESPNSGWPESAFAGALGVQLGGTNFYAGVRDDRAIMGESLNPLETDHIVQANRLMYGSLIVWTIAGTILL